MNYLQICKRVHERSGMSGSGPTSVTNQSPSLMKLVGWVQDADLDIQALKREWKFLWERTPAVMVIGQNSYTSGDFSLDRPKGLDMVKVEGHRMVRMDWDDWVLQIEPLSSSGGIDSGLPTVMTEDPHGNYLFYPTPDQAYNIRFDYFVTPIRLLDDVDVTPIPDEYQDTIVQKALRYYAEFESDMDLYQMSNLNYETKLSILCNEQLPKLGFN